MRPGLAGVGGFVYAVADGEIGPVQPFTAPDINNVRVRRRYGNGPNRPRGLLVKNRCPGAAVVVGLPYSAVAHADIEDVGLAGHAGHCAGASTAEWTNAAPVQGLEKRRVSLSQRL